MMIEMLPMQLQMPETYFFNWAKEVKTLLHDCVLGMFGYNMYYKMNFIFT